MLDAKPLSKAAFYLKPEYSGLKDI